MFVRFDFEVGPTFTTIRSTRGVMDFIRFGQQPKEIQGDLVFQLKQLDPELDLAAVSLPKKGQKMQVKGGQFSGIDAIYQEPDGETRSIMLVTMINQAVPISIDNLHLDID
jgi:transcriptional antiterminator RfaH